MPIPRENAVEWTFWVWLEMFLAGIAAGAYLCAAVLELAGRGRSRSARAAHLIAWPLMTLSALLLIIDLNQPLRFHHMLIGNNTLVPILKIWSPISFGTWLVGAFALVAFISFLDALLDRSRLRLGRWGSGVSLHGGPTGLALAAAGGLLAVGVGSYSGLLLQATSFPGWRDTAMLGAEYMATAAITGVAAILLLRPLLPAHGADIGEDAADLAQLSTYLWLLAGLWLVVTAVFIATSLSGIRFFLHGAWTAFFVAGALLLALPLVLRAKRQNGIFLTRGAAPPADTPHLLVIAGLVLVGGLFMRIALVMGPQWV